MGHPSGTDEQALAAIAAHLSRLDTQGAASAVHLGRLDERSKARSEQLDRMEGGIDKLNGRVRQVEQKQTALEERVKLLTKLGAGASTAFTAVVAWLKMDT